MAMPGSGRTATAALSVARSRGLDVSLGVTFSTVADQAPSDAATALT